MKNLLKQITEILEADGTIIISTYQRAMEYGKKHSTWFTVGKDGELYVQQGNKKNCLSLAGKLLVSVKAYK